MASIDFEYFQFGQKGRDALKNCYHARELQSGEIQYIC